MLKIVTTLLVVQNELVTMQHPLNKELSFVEKKLLAAIEGRDSGLCENGIKKEIDKMRKEKLDIEKKTENDE